MAGGVPRLTIERRVGDASLLVLALDDEDVRRSSGCCARVGVECQRSYRRAWRPRSWSRLLKKPAFCGSKLANACCRPASSGKGARSEISRYLKESVPTGSASQRVLSGLLPGTATNKMGISRTFGPAIDEFAKHAAAALSHLHQSECRTTVGTIADSAICPGKAARCSFGSGPGAFAVAMARAVGRSLPNACPASRPHAPGNRAAYVRWSVGSGMPWAACRAPVCWGTSGLPAVPIRCCVG